MRTGTRAIRMTRDKRWLLILAALSVLPFLLSAGYSLLQLSQSTRDEVAGQLVVKANSLSLIHI